MLDMTKYTNTESKDNEIVVNGARFMVTDSVASKVMELVQNSKTPRTLKVEEPTVEEVEEVEEDIIDIFAMDTSKPMKKSSGSYKGYDVARNLEIVENLKKLGSTIMFDNGFCVVAKKNGKAVIYIMAYKSYGIKSSAKSFGAEWNKAIQGKNLDKVDNMLKFWEFPTIKDAEKFVKAEKEYEKNRESK